MDRELGVFGKARAVLSLAMVGGAIGLVVAPLAKILTGMFPLTCEVVVFESSWWRWVLIGAIPYAAEQWALLGAFTGGGFGTLLSLTRSKRRLEDLSLLRVGALGGLLGAMFWPCYRALVGYPMWIDYAESFTPLAVTGLLGAGLTTGMVALAKRAPAGALPDRDSLDRIAGPVDP